jgi:hypothetical protein
MEWTKVEDGLPDECCRPLCCVEINPDNDPDYIGRGLYFLYYIKDWNTPGNELALEKSHGFIMQGIDGTVTHWMDIKYPLIENIQQIAARQETSPENGIRKAFWDILIGVLPLNRASTTKITMINEYGYWTACWREWLNCGLTVEETCRRLKANQALFNESETLKRLDELKNKNKRPSDSLYAKLFPFYPNGSE